MHNRHQKTLAHLLEDPPRADIEWRAVESLFRALGAEITQGSGSRVRVMLGGVKAVLHRPHPEKEVSKSMVKSIREFLTNAGAL